MGKDVMIACDFSTKKDVMQFLDRFMQKKPFVKIGMELFYACLLYTSCRCCAKRSD